MPRINPVPPRQLVKLFERFGFQPARTEGSHLSMTKPGVRRPVVIPMNVRDVPVPIILNNLRTAGISRDDYLRTIGEV